MAALAFIGALSVSAADSSPGREVSVLITVESKSGSQPVLSSDNIRVQQDRQERPIADLKRLDTGKTQMLVLIDDSAGGDFDSQIPALKKFVNSLAPTVEVGIGYMRNGTAQMTSGFTADHAKAANSIRVALGAGGADVSPYDSLSDAVKKWPQEAGVERKEVVMISSGIEGLGGGLAPDNLYVNAGISDAQKAGVIVYAIYNPGFGHAGHSLWRSTWGQNLLSQLTDETGGELYTVGFGSAVSFDPYLDDILKRQAQQYVLTFESRAENKSGLQQVKITAAQRSFSIAAPDKVYVKASL